MACQVCIISPIILAHRMVLSEPANGVAIVRGACDLVTAFSVPNQLQDGAQLADRSLTLYETHRQAFEPKDKISIVQAVNA
jgi:hypothetical protein